MKSISILALLNRWILNIINKYESKFSYLMFREYKLTIISRKDSYLIRFLIELNILFEIVTINICNTYFDRQLLGFLFNSFHCCCNTRKIIVRTKWNKNYFRTGILRHIFKGFKISNLKSSRSIKSISSFS